MHASSVDVKQPTPVVKIDNQSDTFATIVSIQYGDRLGELLETVSALCDFYGNVLQGVSGRQTSSHMLE